MPDPTYIAIPMGNDECRNLAEQLLDAFRNAGWSPNFQKISYRFDQPKGINVAINNESDSARRIAESLYILFDGMELYPMLQFNSRVEEGKILIIIGTKDTNGSAESQTGS